jgi:hypothetical protein
MMNEEHKKMVPVIRNTCIFIKSLPATRIISPPTRAKRTDATFITIKKGIGFLLWFIIAPVQGSGFLSVVIDLVLREPRRPQQLQDIASAEPINRIHRFATQRASVVAPKSTFAL